MHQIPILTTGSSNLFGRAIKNWAKNRYIAWFSARFSYSKFNQWMRRNLCGIALIFNYALIYLSCVTVDKNGFIGIGYNDVAARHLNRYILALLAKTHLRCNNNSSGSRGSRR